MIKKKKGKRKESEKERTKPNQIIYNFFWIIVGKCVTSQKKTNKKTLAPIFTFKIIKSCCCVWNSPGTKSTEGGIQRHPTRIAAQFTFTSWWQSETMWQGISIQALPSRNFHRCFSEESVNAGLRNVSLLKVCNDRKCSNCRWWRSSSAQFHDLPLPSALPPPSNPIRSHPIPSVPLLHFRSIFLRVIGSSR